jgi:NAD(P)-dependent dehydrogenase (short-subunit alcohol dehydrogenase family)
MFTYELSRRLRGTGVTANALHPGVVHTAFSSEDPSLLAKVALPLMRFMKTPAQGAATSIHLASSPDVEGITGQYFADSKSKASNKASYDIDAANRLWQVSTDLVGLPAG